MKQNSNFVGAITPIEISECEGLSFNEKMVLIYLIQLDDKYYSTSGFYGSQSQMADKLGISRSKIIRILNSLESKNLIDVVRRGNEANYYFIQRDTIIQFTASESNSNEEDKQSIQKEEKVAVIEDFAPLKEDSEIVQPVDDVKREEIDLTNSYIRKTYENGFQSLIDSTYEEARRMSPTFVDSISDEELTEIFRLFVYNGRCIRYNENEVRNYIKLHPENFVIIQEVFATTISTQLEAA